MYLYHKLTYRASIAAYTAGGLRLPGQQRSELLTGKTLLFCAVMLALLMSDAAFHIARFVINGLSLVASMLTPVSASVLTVAVLALLTQGCDPFPARRSHLVRMGAKTHLTKEGNKRPRLKMKQPRYALVKAVEAFMKKLCELKLDTC